MTKENLKAQLLATNMFIDNEYFNLYLDLIINNLATPKLFGKTQKHHILQRKWYTKNKLAIDNSKTNLVNLYYKDHILAHYYLYKCTIAWLKKANIQTLVNMLNLKRNESIAEQLFANIDTLQADYESFVKERYCQQLDQELLYNYYVTENHTRLETAKYFCTTISCIDKCLVRYNINLCKAKTQNRDIIDTKLLEDLYLNKDYTIDQLANYFQASTGKIKYILRSLGVKKNMHRPCPKRQRITCTKEELYRLFIIENKSYKDLANLFDVSLTTIKKYLKQYNIRKDITLRGISISKGKIKDENTVI